MISRTFSVVVLREMDGLFASCCNRSQSADLHGSLEVLHFHPLVLGVMLAKNAGICDQQVKQEPEDILVVLSTLQLHMIITTKLII